MAENTEQGNGGSQLNSKFGREGSDRNFSEIGSNMDIDQPNASKNKLLSEDEIEMADKGQLEDLKRRIESELVIRRKLEADSSSSSQIPNYELSTQELEGKLQKTEKILSSLQNSNLDVDNKNDNGNKVGIIWTIAGISALAIAGIASVKRKLGKSKKK
ncbi:MAG: hypothetical protein NY202_04935 [Mollicutes bacterium UO1]